MQASVSIERLLAIVLALDETRPTSAAALARRLGVSLRTVYRDIRRLQGAGVAVVGIPGQSGGLLLAPGFRLAPMSLGTRETVALSIAIRTLEAMPDLPYRQELANAARKITAAARTARPELLADTGRWLRIEPPAADTFHPERKSEPAQPSSAGIAVEVFADALLAGRAVVLDYSSPYRRSAGRLQIAPAGVIADRGLWYLVGFPIPGLREARYLRADRVRHAEPGPKLGVARVPRWQPGLARPWLAQAMGRWAREAPVEIEICAEQARLLAADWYFGTGSIEPIADGRFRFVWGESDFERVRELVAWLGAPARLVAPREWVERLSAALVDHGRAQLSPRPARAAARER